MKILITGARGQVGTALRHELAGSHEIICPTRQELDLAAPASLRQAVRRIRPDLLINCAAFTAVDAAENQADLAWRINAEAPGLLAAEMQALGGGMIQYSTDYVFDGCLDRPYRESDQPAPLSEYGRSKLAGEQAAIAACATTLVLRLSWVYSTGGRNFLQTIVQLARQREQLSVVNDQIGAPTWSRSIAQATHAAIRSVRQEATGLRMASGCYHLCAAGSTSWHDYAALILRQIAQAGAGPLARLEEISSKQFDAPAARPLNSRLDCAKFIHTFGWTPAAWDSDVIACLAGMLATPAGGAGREK